MQYHPPAAGLCTPFTWVAPIIDWININAPPLQKMSPIPHEGQRGSGDVPYNCCPIKDTAYNYGGVCIIRYECQCAFGSSTSKDCCLHGSNLCKRSVPYSFGVKIGRNDINTHLSSIG